MGRDLLVGSFISLDSLDEVFQVVGFGIGRGLGIFFKISIMDKRNKEVKFVGKRRVIFFDSIEFDDGVIGQFVIEEK